MEGRRAVSAGCGILLVALALVGCGESSGQQGDGAGAAAGCRAQWKRLGHDIADEAAGTLPSDLPDRWNNLVATVDYYRTSAGAQDCGSRLKEQRSAIAALKAFGTQLAPYDMQARLADVRDDATAYAAGPWPAAPTPSASPSGKAGKKHQPKPLPRPPKPALVRAALSTLTQQAPQATSEQEAGWEQAGVTELTDAAARAKAVKDLRFLSAESPAYRRCRAALTLIAKGLAAKG